VERGRPRGEGLEFFAMVPKQRRDRGRYLIGACRRNGSGGSRSEVGGLTQRRADTRQIVRSRLDQHRRSDNERHLFLFFPV